MASDKSHQQVTSTDSGENSISIQPINETQKERDLATFVTTHSPSFLSQVQNSSLIPEKSAALFSSTSSSFGSTSEEKSFKPDLISDKVINNIDTKMENNNSKDKQDVKPALPTGWNPSNSFSTGANSTFNKPSANPTHVTSNNHATAPKFSAPTTGFVPVQSKESKPQENPTLTASKPSLPTSNFGFTMSGTANLGTGVSQPKPSISNTSQASSFNLVNKSSQDIKPVSSVNPAQGVPKSNPIPAFGVSKTNTNVMTGSQAPKSDKPLGGSNNGSNSLSQNVNVTKSQSSLSSNTSGSFKDSNTTIPPAVKANPPGLPTPSVSNTGMKDIKQAVPSVNQSSTQATNKNLVPGTGQFSTKPGLSNVTKPNQDIQSKSDASYKISTGLSNTQSTNKPASSVNPVSTDKHTISNAQASISKNDSSNIGKVPENKPISIIGQSYTTKPAPTTSNQPPLSKPVSTPVAQPTASKPVLPEVTQLATPKPDPPKVTQSTISKPVVTQNTIPKPVAPQSTASKPTLPSANQSSAPKPTSSSTNQIPATVKASITPQSVSDSKNNETKKESKSSDPALSKNLSAGDKVLHDPKGDSKVVSSQSSTRNEIVKPSEEKTALKEDASKKTENDKSNQVSKEEFKRPLDVGSKDSNKAPKISGESDIVSKTNNQEKNTSKNLSVSFSEKNIPESAKNIKVETKSFGASKPTSGTKRSSEEVTKKQDAKAPNKVKKTKSGTFVNEIPDRKEKAGELLICGRGSSQLGIAKKNAELLELTSVEKLPSNIVDVSCGLNHTLALTSDGDIYSWGVNSKHALGRNGDTSVPTKVTFDEEVNIIQLAAGNSFSAALTDSGKVYAWGTFLSDNEVLGFYESAGKSQEEPIKIGDKLPKGTEFTQIVAGKDHLLLLTTKGRIYAMGDMKYGQLGVRILRQKKDDDIPQGLRLNCLSLMNVVQIFAGGYHSFAINKKDEVFSWGQNNYYQCGIPSSSPSYDVTIEIPTKSVSIMNLGDCNIFGGDYFTLALNEDGELYGFGLAEGGILGVPMDTTSFSTIDDKKVLEEPEHIIFPNSAEVTHVATGSNHSVVYAGSKLYSWGTEFAATGHSKAVNTPTAINSPDSENLLMLSAGYQHSTFLIAGSDNMC